MSQRLVIGTLLRVSDASAHQRLKLFGRETVAVVLNRELIELRIIRVDFDTRGVSVPSVAHQLAKGAGRRAIKSTAEVCKGSFVDPKSSASFTRLS